MLMAASNTGTKLPRPLSLDSCLYSCPSEKKGHNASMHDFIPFRLFFPQGRIHYRGEGLYWTVPVETCWQISPCTKEAFYIVVPALKFCASTPLSWVTRRQGRVEFVKGLYVPSIQLQIGLKRNEMIDVVAKVRLARELNWDIGIEQKKNCHKHWRELSIHDPCLVRMCWSVLSPSCCCFCPANFFSFFFFFFLPSQVVVCLLVTWSHFCEPWVSFVCVFASSSSSVVFFFSQHHVRRLSSLQEQVCNCVFWL